MLENLKLKKVIKSFVPKPILCFQIPICIWTLWTFNEHHVYFTYSYLGRSRGPIMMQQNFWYDIQYMLAH